MFKTTFYFENSEITLDLKSPPLINEKVSIGSHHAWNGLYQITDVERRILFSDYGNKMTEYYLCNIVQIKGDN